jgi:pyruvate formate lyase activating enzyme
MKGWIHSIESFGSADGPGVRFVIFVQGCQFRCLYCHNADSWIQQEGTLMDSDELLAKALRYRSYWGSEGGITVSGGEPLLQMEFVTDLFQKAKEQGVSTCIDTAMGPYIEDPAWKEKFDALMAVTDLLLVDIKEIDPNKHKALTGWKNEHVLKGLRYLSAIGKPVWIRHVLVPGVTDNDQDLMRTRSFIDSLSNVERVEVLPYHSMGAFKWEKMGLKYPLDGVKSPSQKRIENAERILCRKEKA